MAMRLPKPGETGDLTASHRLWVVDKGNPQRVGTGVIAGGHVYILNDPGVAECIELKTGRQVWKQRAANSAWGSMVLAGDKIYVVNQSGDTIVIQASPQFEILQINSIGNEMCNASVVPSNGDLFIRTHKNLWCISNTTKTASR